MDDRRPGKLAASLFTLFFLSCVHAAASDYPLYPRIERLDNSDVLFRQIQDDISEFHRSMRGGGEPPELSIFRYELEPEDTFLRVTSRLALPHATVASLNGLRGSAFPEKLEEILVPNQPGVFATTNPQTDLEYMLSGRIPEEAVEPGEVAESEVEPEQETPADPQRARSRTVSDTGLPVTLNTANGQRSYYFFPGDDFTGAERRAFLGVLFRSPVNSFRLTSPFGTRSNPFTGRPSFHTGIDLAADEGTPTRAVREGTVIEADFDPVYGNYVIIEHDEVFTSFYGHLSGIAVESGSQVRAGTVIGEVGSTGLSTGPHLHFEIRVRGEARDPSQFVPGI